MPQPPSPSSAPSRCGFKGLAGSIIALLGLVILVYQAQGLSISPSDLPAEELFSLSDIHGKTISPPENKQAVILIVSAPDPKHTACLQAWTAALGKKGSPCPAGNTSLFVLQDLPASPKEKALLEIRKSCGQEKNALVLLDTKGALRKKLGMPEGETRILVYDSRHRLQWVEEGTFSEAALRRVQQASL